MLSLSVLMLRSSQCFKWFHSMECMNMIFLLTCLSCWHIFQFETLSSLIKLLTNTRYLKEWQFEKKNMGCISYTFLSPYFYHLNKIYIQNLVSFLWKEKRKDKSQNLRFYRMVIRMGVTDTDQKVAYRVAQHAIKNT